MKHRSVPKPLPISDYLDPGRRVKWMGDCHPATTDKEYTAEELEFVMAMYNLKKRLGRHPTCADVLAEAHRLGYRNFPESVPTGVDSGEPPRTLKA